MPQSSIPYASARVSALGKRLLDQQTVKRMADGSLDDVMRILQDFHYGGMADVTAEDCERMIESERIRTAQEIREISPIPDVTDLFLLQTDVQNLKLLVKARLLEINVCLQAGGLYSSEKLQHMVFEQDYRELPTELRKAMQQLEQKLKIEVDPQQVSVEIDKGYLSHALDIAASDKTGFAAAYFTALCDFDNVITLLRLRAMNAPKEDLKSMLLPAGKITHQKLMASYDLPLDSLARAFPAGDAQRAMFNGFSKMQQSGNIASLEHERDDYLLSLVKSHKHESMSVYPVLGYLLAKDREARAIRLIVTVKRNGLDDAVIQERLCELYG